MEFEQLTSHVKVMTYDLMNRRMNATQHHSAVAGSAETIDTYIKRGMDAAKMGLGLAFYAKWFTTIEGVKCTKPIGCTTELLEAADGSDTGKSGAVTFEQANYAQAQGVPPSFTTAMANGLVDEEHGGEWYWDADSRLFWTWDTPALIARKFTEIVESRGLGGVFAWSLAQDSHDWTHIKAMQKGVSGISGRRS
jgi:chitinase